MKNRLIPRIKKKGRKFKENISLYALTFDSNPQVRKLAKALIFIKNKKNWEKEEKSCFNVINELREQYSSSKRALKIRDYGAGNPNSQRTLSEMEIGVEFEKQISEIYKVAASPKKWGELIFKIIREVKPQKILELGTSLGISAAYQITALKLNRQGEFISIEGSNEVAKIAAQNLVKVGYKNFTVKTGKFKDVLPEILVRDANIDMVFIDGHHDKVATKEYFEMLYPHLAENSILIFDDINWSPGMQQVWKEIYSDERINVSFDLHKWGICHIDKKKKGGKRKYFKLSP